MSMSWGGVIASALAGGAAGAMGSVAKDIDEQQKSAIQAKRDATLAQLARENHKANAQASADIDLAQIPLKAAATNDALNAASTDANTREVAAIKAKAPAMAEAAGKLTAAQEAEKFHTLSPGVRLVKGDKVVIDGAPRELTAEEADYFNARADEARARGNQAQAKADKTEAGSGAKPDKVKAEKPFAWEAEKGSREWSQDKTTGYYKRVISGKAGDPGSSGFLGMGKRDPVPASEGVTEYYAPDKKTKVTFEEVDAKRNEDSGNKPRASGVVNTGAAPASADDPVALAKAAYQFIKQHPEKAADVKAAYKAKTGKDLRP
jgi:hypothetical protein